MLLNHQKKKRIVCPKTPSLAIKPGLIGLSIYTHTTSIININIYTHNFNHQHKTRKTTWITIIKERNEKWNLFRLIFCSAESFWWQWQQQQMTAAAAGGNGGGDSATSSSGKLDSWRTSSGDDWRAGATSSGDDEIAVAATSSGDEIPAAKGAAAEF